MLPTTAVLSTVLSAFLVNSPAFAGIGVGVAPTYPPLVVVGNTNLAVSLSLTNVSTAPESGGPITLSLIRHTPSCVSDTTPCLPGDEDPGVFLVKGFPDGKAHGRAGTACGDPNVPGGMNFTIGPPNATTGEVEFIPDSGNVILTSPSGAFPSCTIDFFVDVLKLPRDGDPVQPNAQTHQLGRVSATTGIVSATGTGSGLTTVVAPTPTPTNTPTNTPTPTPTNTPTPTTTRTNTPTGTPTSTPTSTPTRTSTPTPTLTPTPTPSPPPIPVVPSPTSPAGIVLILGLSLSIGWMLRRVGRAAGSR